MAESEVVLGCISIVGYGSEVVSGWRRCWFWLIVLVAAIGAGRRWLWWGLKMVVNEGVGVGGNLVGGRRLKKKLG